jgi:hypothetical protein
LITYGIIEQFLVNKIDSKLVPVIELTFAVKIIAQRDVNDV